MGRPPCCDKDGIKKGPWTPEEDIILESYISEHGPGNWRLVPANTGLLRCSKSCRLRWTNYLRPGIKRGNFTTHEEKLIVYLQSKLGNKWASIASYLPQRTDNDIKNYWNTHLKKKTKKYQSALDPLLASSLTTSHLITRRYVDKRSKDLSNQAPLFRFNQASTYASSTENISRLLEGWMKSSPNSSNDLGKTQEEEKNNSSSRNNNIVGSSTDNNADQQENCDVISNEELESLLSFDNISNMSWEKSSTESKTIYTDEKFKTMSLENDEEKLEDEPPFSLLEKWLLEESAGQVEDLMNLSPIF